MNAPQRNTLLFLVFAGSVLGQNTVGGGAPNEPAFNAFQAAFFQNGFDLLVNPVPTIEVSKLGATGYYQTFTSLTSSSQTLALILPSIAAAGVDGGVLQVINPMYQYYSSVTEAAAGYPTINTQTCPGIASCVYQLFSNGYALFYYSAGNPNGSGFSTSGNIFTLWNSLGGAQSPLGMAYNAQATVTSVAGTTANYQTFTSGDIVTVTSGINSGSTYAVVEPIWDVYNAAGGPASVLGLPTSSDVTQPDGSHKQTFEAGRIVYTTGSTPTILFPVADVSITPTAAVTLQYGQTLTIAVNVSDTAGQPATGRTISWATSNSNAVSLTPNGYSAVLKGVGSGIANITATSEGIVSKALVVTSVEPCCQIGQGAPNAAVQAAFQAAVTRNKLTVLVPAATPVRQVGSGYVQDLYSPDGTQHYLVAEANSSSVAYVVTGALLTAYTADGGPAGPLAYPISDPGSGGTQLFQGGALAGNPVQAVSGAILTKWAANQYEAGPLGIPTAPQSAFTSPSGYTGYSQSFAGGTIFGISNGALAGQGFLSSGPVLSLYLSLKGPSGELGVPLADLSTTGGVTRQNFENGYIDLQPGASTAVEHLNPRTPAVTVTPATVLPGNKVHISISGFNNNANLTVTLTGQPNFQVAVPAGVYQWDAYIAVGTAAGAVTIKATDSSNSASTASATYTVRSLAAAQPQLLKYQGDNQTGAPGSLLATPLTVALVDNTNTPISGVTVTFSPSPGASVSPVTAVTDSNGHAATYFHLPATPGIAAVSAQALNTVAIFDAAVSGSYSLPSYPNFVAVSGGGAEVAAVASIVRFYQNSGSMPAPNGQATPQSLTQFLETIADGFLNSSQLVNLWRLVNFTGSNLTVSPENTDLPSIRTLVSGGNPVLLSLALTQDGNPASGESVVATGIDSDGSIAILDPNPAFARANLNDYLNTFSANGHAYQGKILTAVRLLPQAPKPGGFLLTSISQPASTTNLAVQSPGASCTPVLIFQDAFIAGGALPNPVLTSQLLYCDGAQVSYQASVGSLPAALTDLASTPGSGVVGLTTGTYQISQAAGKWTATPPSVSFNTAAVLNAATFQPGISPGGIFSIFGSALASSQSSATAVSIGGLPATVLLATPFQINAQVPPAAAIGNTSLQVTSPYGSASQSVSIEAVSPGIFVIGTASDGVTPLGAIVNQSGAINGPTAPAPRGSTVVIYCTGLGATTVSKGLSVASSTVTAVLSGTSLPVAFAGLTPGFVGLYQVNLTIPAATPPGLLLPLALNSANVIGNTVALAVQ